jgi:hypothetical protein
MTCIAHTKPLHSVGVDVGFAIPDATAHENDFGNQCGIEKRWALTRFVIIETEEDDPKMRPPLPCVALLFVESWVCLRLEGAVLM